MTAVFRFFARSIWAIAKFWVSMVAFLFLFVWLPMLVLFVIGFVYYAETTLHQTPYWR